MPPISVVIPCYNAAAWLAETLASVVGQAAVDTEIILVDDGSNDGSVDIALDLSLPNLRVIRQSRLGASRARNVGTDASTAPFIQYLDADDVLTPGALAARLAALEASGSDIAYSDFVRWERQPDGGFAEGTRHTRVLGDRPDAEILLDAWWPPGALLYRRSIVERIMPWREDLPIIQDARFLLDAALVGGRFVHVAGLGLRYRVHSNQSLSRRDPRAFVDDCHRSIIDLDRTWQTAGTKDPVRQVALTRAYGSLARAYFPLDRDRFTSIVERLNQLEPGFIPDAPRHFRWLAKMVGYARAEQLAAWLRPVLHKVGV